jgi:serine/threonine protein kinase
MGCGSSSGIHIQGPEFDAKYSISGEILGSGSYGIVYKALKRENNELYAAKTIKKAILKAEDHKVVKNEVEVMIDINHKNCIRLEEYFTSKEAFTLVMECVTGGEVFDRICEKNYYSEAEAAKTMHELGECLHHLHSHGIIHRDLKPENLLYADDSPDAELKVTDFGLAKRLGPDGTLNTQCGTPNYVAPEILHGHAYGPPVDMWSAGVILYILLSGIPPFWAEDTSELYESIKSASYEFPEEHFGNISKEAIDIVKGLMTLDSNKRMTAKQLIEHPWVNGGARTDNIGEGVAHRIRQTETKIHLRKFIHAVMAIERVNKIILLDEHDDYRSAVKDLKHTQHLLSSDAEEQELLEAFHVINGNTLGEMNTYSLWKSLDSMGHKHSQEKVAENFLKRVDHDGDGYISLEEFEFLMKKQGHTVSHEEELREVFDVIDTDKDGGITKKELATALSKLGVDEREDIIAEMVESVDTDGDGEISFEEFLVMMNEKKK